MLGLRRCPHNCALSIFDSLNIITYLYFSFIFSVYAMFSLSSFRVATHQGKIREKIFFSRSGKYQGISFWIREKQKCVENQGKIREFWNAIHFYIYMYKFFKELIYFFFVRWVFGHLEICYLLYRSFYIRPALYLLIFTSKCIKTLPISCTLPFLNQNGGY